MSTHRQFIPYQENVAIPPASSSSQVIPHYCQRCSSPIASNHKCLCDLCWSMLEAVASPYWHKLQREWWAENDRRKVNKARLLAGDGESDDYHSA